MKHTSEVSCRTSLKRVQDNGAMRRPIFFCNRPSRAPAARSRDVECVARRCGKFRHDEDTPRRRIPERHCAGTEPLPDNTHLTTQPNWAQRAREVPDILVAAQLSLGALARGESIATSAEARRIVRDACDLLRVAVVNLVEVTRHSPGFPLGSNGHVDGVDKRGDPRISAPSCYDDILAARRVEQCALTRRGARPVSSVPEVRLTGEQLDRLRRCANGNTLRFESTAIVAALVAAGYATEGTGCIVKVTPKGHRYLQTNPE